MPAKEKNFLETFSLPFRGTHAMGHHLIYEGVTDTILAISGYIGKQKF